MATNKQLLHWHDNDLDELTLVLDQLIDGQWANLEPVVGEEDLADLRSRTPNPLVRMFMKAGAPIPMGTLAVAGDRLTIGLEHPHAAKALPFLREHGVEYPAEWRIKQDHPRRGIVFDAPRGASVAAVRWVVRATGLLAAVPVGHEWTALVHRP